MDQVSMISRVSPYFSNTKFDMSKSIKLPDVNAQLFMKQLMRWYRQLSRLLAVL